MHRSNEILTPSKSVVYSVSECELSGSAQQGSPLLQTASLHLIALSSRSLGMVKEAALPTNCLVIINALTVPVFSLLRSLVFICDRKENCRFAAVLVWGRQQRCNIKVDRSANFLSPIPFLRCKILFEKPDGLSTRY